MPYTPTSWQDRQVQNPMTFNASGAVTGIVTLTPAEGNIIQPGTPITSTNLNNLETQYQQALNDATAACNNVPNWTNATLINNWAEYGGSPLYAYAGYLKQPNGLVLLRGAIKGGSTGSILFTLPAGYRPQYDAAFAGVDGNNNHCTIVARADGTVVLLASTGYTVNTSFISLEGVRFQTKTS